MRKSLVLATLVVFACSAAAFAGVPDPTKSGCQLVGNPLPCQFRFRSDGGLDKLTLKVTLRDNFDAPVANCSTYCRAENFAPIASSQECGGNLKGGLTDAGGVVNFIFSRVGGYGTFDLKVTSKCPTAIGICESLGITYTGPNMDGSVNGNCNIIDVSSFALCYPPSGTYCLRSDFDCNGAINIIDWSQFTTGLPLVCP